MIDGRSLVPFLILSLLTACAAPRPFSPRVPPQKESTPGESNVQTKPAATPEPPAPAQSLPNPSPVPAPHSHTLSAASKALVAQAQAQSNAGNDALAAATIERALRIESDNPLLWIELAKVRQNEGDAAQAENMARKALAMSNGDNKVQAAAWRVIAESFRARGRNPEARDADAKAVSLAGGS
jgi:predicted Zn-dependent protease